MLWVVVNGIFWLDQAPERVFVDVTWCVCSNRKSHLPLTPFKPYHRFRVSFDSAASSARLATSLLCTEREGMMPVAGNIAVMT
jgi:hypothetical protein